MVEVHIWKRITWPWQSKSPLWASPSEQRREQRNFLFCPCVQLFVFSFVRDLTSASYRQKETTIIWGRTSSNTVIERKWAKKSHQYFVWHYALPLTIFSRLALIICWFVARDEFRGNFSEPLAASMPRRHRTRFKFWRRPTAVKHEDMSWVKSSFYVLGWGWIFGNVRSPTCVCFQFALPVQREC